MRYFGIVGLLALSGCDWIDPPNYLRCSIHTEHWIASGQTEKNDYLAFFRLSERGNTVDRLDQANAKWEPEPGKVRFDKGFVTISPDVANYTNINRVTGDLTGMAAIKLDGIIETTSLNGKCEKVDEAATKAKF